MEKSFKVTTPLTPNFITVGEQNISIADFTDEELKKIAEDWGFVLINKAQQMRRVANK